VGGNLGELLRRYRDTLVVKPGTATAYGHTLRNLREYFGEDKPLSAITALDADNYRAWLGEHEQLSTATVNRRIVAAKAIFRKGLRWGMMQDDPFAGVKGGGSSNESRKRFIPPADVARVMEACSNVQSRCLVALSRFGGLRVPSEALLLCWGDIDWNEAALRVHSPKTEHHAGQAERVIPLFPELKRCCRKRSRRRSRARNTSLRATGKARRIYARSLYASSSGPG
jgi:integrase